MAREFVKFLGALLPAIEAEKVGDGEYRIVVESTGGSSGGDVNIAGIDAGVTLPVSVADPINTRCILDEIKPGAHTDAFQRLRVSEAHSLFNGIQDEDERPELYRERIAGGASAIYVKSRASYTMTVTNIGDKFVRQSRVYFPYKAANGMLFFLTLVAGTPEPGVRQRFGAFDDSDGLFFEVGSDGILYVVRRSSVSGSVVDTKIPQSEWNGDRLDGTGPSGMTIDPSKAQIAVIDYQWLGVGAARFAVDIDGALIVCHQMDHANNVDSVYMSSGSQPVRYEIEAVTQPVQPASMEQICSAVLREGSVIEEGSSGSASTGINTVDAIAGNDWQAIVGIRTIAGARSVVQYLSGTAKHKSAGDDIEVILVTNPRYAGTPVWAQSPGDVKGVVEKCTTGGGTVIDGAWEYEHARDSVLEADRGSHSASGNAAFGGIAICVDLDGNHDEMWILARATGTVPCYVTLNYTELR